MKRLAVKFIPAVLLIFAVIYNSCNDQTIQSNLKTENGSQTPSEQTINKDETSLRELPSLNDKMKSNNSDTLRDDDVPWCTLITIDPDTSVYVPTGSSFNWNFRVRSSMVYSASYAVRLVIIYLDGNQIGSYSNWTTGQCVYPSWINNYQNNFNSTLTIPHGNHTVTARLIYHYTIAGVTNFVDISDNAYVNITQMDLQSVPYVNATTTGFPPNRRSYLTWPASTPGVTHYVVQKKAGGGSFYDYALSKQLLHLHLPIIQLLLLLTDMIMYITELNTESALLILLGFQVIRPEFLCGIIMDVITLH